MAVIKNNTLDYYRKLYFIGCFTNAISFALFFGNIFTLYLIHIGATKSLIGVFSAIQWFSLLCAGMGKPVVKKLGVVKTTQIIWIFRSLVLLPQAVTPLLIVLDIPKSIVFTLLLFVQIMFQFARGIGGACYNPIYNNLTTPKNRTGFFIVIRIITNVSELLIILVAGYLFKIFENLLLYSFLFFAGVVFSLLSAFLFGRQEEPIQNVSQQHNVSLIKSLYDFARNKESRTYTIAFVLSQGLIAGAITFLIVFFKEVYHLSESQAIAYSVGGPISAVIIGFVARPIFNRVGPKPGMIFGILCLLAGMILLQFNFSGRSWTVIWVVGIYIIFTLGFGNIQDNIQAYFLNHYYDPADMNSGLFTIILLGTGGIGAIIAGFTIDVLKIFFYTPAATFQVFWFLMMLGALVVFFLFLKLERGESMSLGQSLGIFISPKEWFGIWELEHGMKNATVRRHQETFSRLHTKKAYKTLLQEIPQLLRCPSLQLRLEGIEVIRNKKIEFNEELTELVIAEVMNSPYTTGANAAFILGERGITKAIPVLRDALDSEDYNLTSQSMLALAKLGDKDSLPVIRNILKTETSNQRVIIFAINALSIMKDSMSDISLLLEMYEIHNTSDRVQEEITIALSIFFEIESHFYSTYYTYLQKPANTWNEEATYLQKKIKNNVSLSHLQYDYVPFFTEKYKDNSPEWLAKKYETLCIFATTLAEANILSLEQNSMLNQIVESNYGRSETGMFFTLVFINILLGK